MSDAKKDQDLISAGIVGNTEMANQDSWFNKEFTLMKNSLVGLISEVQIWMPPLLTFISRGISSKRYDVIERKQWENVIIDNLVPVMNTSRNIILRRKFVQNKMEYSMEGNQSEHRTWDGHVWDIPYLLFSERSKRHLI